MAKIIDPDFIIKGTEISFFTASDFRIQLFPSGNLDPNDGVTFQCIYSKCKELWKTDATLIRFPFPLISITDKKFDYVNDWNWFDTASQTYVRDAGWSVKDSLNNSIFEYMGFKTLGTVQATHQIYYQQTGSGPDSIKRDTVYLGAANEPVEIFASGTFDWRDYFKAFVREYQYTYAQAELSDIGETVLTYQSYAFPLANTADTKVTNPDATISADYPYISMSINYYTSSQTRTVGGTPWEFTTIITASGGTKEEVYEFVQYQLRQNDNIDNLGNIVVGVTGSTANSLLSFVGDTLVGADGVFIDGFALADINSIEFHETGSTIVLYPFVAAGTIAANTNLTTDVSGSFKMFFTSVLSGSFGTNDAVLVNDNDGYPITGSLYGSSSVAFSFDYDNNNQGGRTVATDAAVTIVALGLNVGQYVLAEGTIARSNANAFSLVAALERNYSNPA